MQSHQPIKLAILAVFAIAWTAAIPTSTSAQTYPGLKCIVDGTKQCHVRYAVKWREGKVYFASRQAADHFREMTERKSPSRQRTSLTLKANHQLALTGQYTQRRCPVTGNASSKTIQVPVAGLRVFLHDLAAKERIENIKSTLGRAQFVFADSIFTEAFSLAQKKKPKESRVTPGANQPVSIADSSGTTDQRGKKN